MRRGALLPIALILLATPAAATSLDEQTINGAQWDEHASPAEDALSPVVIKLQVLLDRAHFSPGEIDGKFGENVGKAVSAFALAHGADPSDGMTDALWTSLTGGSEEPAVRERRISDDDVKGPFIDKIPAKMEDMKDLPALSYTSPREKIAEEFHMSQQLLSALNPGQKFETAGDTILVANVTNGDLPAKVARIEVDKSAQMLRAFDKDNNLLAVYPVTVGSAEKPAPSGELKVISVTKNPTYRYNPDYDFKGVKTNKPFTIKPGPNNPVGLVWIGLNKEGYGIHGTPEPGKISKAASHGCIRLTNWDALQLASTVSKGVPVDFLGGKENDASSPRAQARSKIKRR